MVLGGKVVLEGVPKWVPKVVQKGSDFRVQKVVLEGEILCLGGSEVARRCAGQKILSIRGASFGFEILAQLLTLFSTFRTQKSALERCENSLLGTHFSCAEVSGSEWKMRKHHPGAQRL